MTVEGSGQSKKKAKHLAARNMLKLMITENNLIENKKPIEDLIKRCEDEDKSETLAIQKQEMKLKSYDITEDSTTGNITETLLKSQQSTTVDSLSIKSQSQINSLTTASVYQFSKEEANPIGKLQEICMKKHWHPPVYEDGAERGQPHERVFEVVCRIDNMDLEQIGKGKSKKLAKRNSAQVLFMHIFVLSCFIFVLYRKC